MYDILVFNAKIYTMEKEGEYFSAMGIKEGKIDKMFKENPSNPKTLAKYIIDIKGKTIIPGLIDSHIHFMPSAAFLAFGLPISEINNNNLEPNSLFEVKNKVIKFSKKIPRSKPIMCTNYISSSIKERRLPYNYEIDEWLPNREVVFFNIDGHSCSCSTLLLKKSGIGLSNNGILNDQEFVEKISKYFYNSIGIGSILKGVEILSNKAIEYGIVGFSCMEGYSNSDKDISILLFKKISKILPFYMRIYPQIRNLDIVEKIKIEMKSPRVGGCGLWQIDGSVGSKTAAFYEVYKNTENNTGIIQYDKKELLENVIKAYEKNYQITVHAIGTRAIDNIIDVYNEVLCKHNDYENKKRLRIEHFEFPSNEAVKKAVEKLHIIIVPQPGFNWMDNNFPEIQTYKKSLPENIINLQIPLKKIVQNGGIIAGSSDSPVQSMNPFLQIHGMVNFPIKKERLSIYEAIRTYTYNGAYSTFEENERGTLKEGKYADFIVLNSDPFKMNSKDIINLKVENTFIQGKKINKIKINLLTAPFKIIFYKKKKI